MLRGGGSAKARRRRVGRPRPRLAALALRPDVALVALLLALASAAVSLHVFSIFGLVPGAELLATGVLGGLAVVPRLAWSRSAEERLIVHTAAATASVGAALVLTLPLGLAAAVGQGDLAPFVVFGALLVGATALVALACLFDAPMLPASAPWPPAWHIAWTLVQPAADRWRALSLAAGLVLAQVPVPGLSAPSLSAFGLGFLGNTIGLAFLAAGLVLRPTLPFFVHVDLDAFYVPQGLLLGAALAAVLQAATGSLGQVLLGRRLRTPRPAVGRAPPGTASSLVGRALSRTLTAVIGEGPAARRQLRVGGLVLATYLIVDLATLGPAWTGGSLSLAALLGLGVLAALLTLASQLFGGFVAARVGWLPTLGVGLGLVALGTRLGLPPAASVLMLALVAAAGPPLAELGYYLKAARELGHGALAGRQLAAALLGLLLAAVVVGLGARLYVERGFIPPAAGALAVVLELGHQADGLPVLAPSLLAGLLIQLIGGPSRHVGLLLATGLLLDQPSAGWALLAGLATHTLLSAILRGRAETSLAILGLGCIAGELLRTILGS